MSWNETVVINLANHVLHRPFSEPIKSEASTRRRYKAREKVCELAKIVLDSHNWILLIQTLLLWIPRYFELKMISLWIWSSVIYHRLFRTPRYFGTIFFISSKITK